MRFVYYIQKDWPPNAWHAVIRRKSLEVEILHGSQVETSNKWFCEAVWDGDFSNGAFDQTDIVIGSGCRLRNDDAIFVSAGTTTDRLQYSVQDDNVYISNSLPCLLNFVKGNPDLHYLKYYADFRSVIDGLTKFNPYVHISGANVRLCYFNNLRYSRQSLQVVEKPILKREFTSFMDYRMYMGNTMRSVFENASSTYRKCRYAPLGTLSTGYDSPTVSVLGKEVGLEKVLTFKQARGGVTDDGTEIAGILGLETLSIERDTWRKMKLPEVPFLSANAYGEEVHYSGVGELLEGKILLTGFHGDKVWDTETKALGPDIVRGDPTGLSLTEFRLRKGFLHAAVPFWGVRQIKDIHRISTSSEMKRWDTGGGYSRPICRRIVEEEGVPRDIFGQTKKAASVVLWNPMENFLSPFSMNDFKTYLQTLMLKSPRRFKIPPLWKERVHRLLRYVSKEQNDSELNILLGKIRGGSRLKKFIHQPALFPYLFPWATDRSRKSYQISSLSGKHK